MKIDLDDGMPPNLSEALLPASPRLSKKSEKHQSLEKLERAESLESCASKAEGYSYSCDEASYGIGDAVFSCAIVAPHVVSMWRGTWGIMELKPQLFPYAQIYLIGIVIHISFALVRGKLLKRSAGAYSSPNGGFICWMTERVLSRVYTYIFILCNIMHWRGGWGLLDSFVDAMLPNKEDPHRPVLIAAMSLAFYVTITLLRSSRNLLASPYFLVTDGKEPTYIFTTRFKVSKTFEVMEERDSFGGLIKYT